MQQPSHPTPITRLAEHYSDRFSDSGNAHRFIALHAHILRYVPSFGWLIWDGKRWHKDTTNHIITLAQATIDDIYQEASSLPPDQYNRCKDILTHAQHSSNSKRLHAMINLAQNDPTLHASPQSLDADSFLLTVLNGTINLRTGQLQPHQPQDFITHLAPVVYDPAACSPLWDKFLSDITCRDLDLQHYLQCAIGYSLTGSIKEQAIFLLHGPGCNGKSSFLDAIRSALGDYAQRTPAHLITSRSIPSTPVPTSLLGVRLATTSEIEPGSILDTTSIKHITGGEITPTSTKSVAPLPFQHHFKLWLATNHLPTVREHTIAIWRRIKLIPFSASFVTCEDKDLATKLQTCAPTILNWAIQGCLTWQRQGLPQSTRVQQASAGYQDEQDNLADFLLNLCVLGPEQSVQASDLYRIYQHWCTWNGDDKPLDAKSFSQQILAHGYRRERKATGKIYRGIGLTISPVSHSEMLPSHHLASPDNLHTLSQDDNP